LGSTASNAEQSASEPPRPPRPPPPSPPSPPSERRSLVFRVGEALYACDIELVREIVRLAPLTRIPGSPAFVRGLLNVRGEVLTVLDLGVRLRPDCPPADRGSVIVVDTDRHRAGLIVEEVVGVQAVAPAERSGQPPTDASEIVRPMGHLDGRIVLYLDVRAFVNQSLV
jgi:purine-binding chemotaxis protein CheW